VSEEQDMGDSFTIKVKTLGGAGGAAPELTVSKQTTVPELRRMLHEATGVPPGDQRLIFLGKVLKDENTVGDFALKEGATLHMVQRPGGGSAAPPAAGAAPAAAAAPAAGAAPGGRQGVAVVGMRVPEDGNPLEQILNGVLTGLGLSGVPSGVTSTGSAGGSSTGGDASGEGTTAAQADPEEAAIASSIAALDGRLPGGPLDDTAASGPIPALGAAAESVAALLGRAQAQVRGASTALAGDGHLAGDGRTAAQEEVRRAGVALAELGALCSTFGRRLQRVQLGDTTGAAAISNSSRSSVINMPFGPVQLRVDDPHGLMGHLQRNGNSSAASAPASPTPAAAPAGAAPMATATATVSASTSVGATPPAAAAAPATVAAPAPSPAPAADEQQQQQAQPAAGAAASPLAGLLSQLGGAAGQAGGGNAREGNPMASMLSQMMGAFTQPAADGQANPLAQMMQGLVGQLQPGAAPGAVQRTAGSAAPAPATAAGSAPASAAAATEPMLDSMIDVSALSGPLGDVVRLVATRLTVSEAMQVMQGNWAPMEKARGALETYLRDLLDGDLSDANTWAFAASIVQTLGSSMSDSTLPTAIADKVRPGQSVTRAALSVAQEHIPGMIRIVCNSSGGGSFALAIRAWTTNFIGSLMERLVGLMSNGEEGALSVVQHFVSARVAQFRPDMAPMIAGMLSSSVARIYQEYRLSRRGVPSEESAAAPAQVQATAAEEEEEEVDILEVPSAADMEIDSTGWMSTVKEDEERQRTLPEQRPFSDAYQEGMPPQKRQKAADEESSAADLLQRRVAQAAAHSDVLQGDVEGQREIAAAASQAPVVGLYVQQLASDLRQRLRTDPDFDAGKFPNAARLLEQDPK